MNRLRELREEKGLNKAEMADELCLAYTTYIGYEKGERDPKSEKWKEFAKHFGVSIDYIIGISEIRKPVTTLGDGQEENEENIIVSDYDKRFLAWFHSIPEEKRKAILISQDAPKDLL